MQPPAFPLTREGVLAWARGLADDPDAIRPHPHPAFETDPVAGGFAATDARLLYWVCHNHDLGYGLLDSHPDVDGYLDQVLARNRHTTRDLAWDELGRWQRAAVTAARAGRTVDELPAADRSDLDTPADRDHADWIWLHLHRAVIDPVRVLAREDRLLAEPDPATQRTHPCPLCWRPARHTPRYPRTVCDDCRDRTADAAGRRIAGYNTSLTGGFEARYVDTDEVCREVTRFERCWVDGNECTIRDARFGGVVVEAR